MDSSAHACKRSFALSTRRQTCSQKSQVGRCTRHLPDKNKSLGAEHHKCSRCPHVVQRGSRGHHDGPLQPTSFEYSKIDSNSAKNSLKRHWLLSPQASSSVPQEHVASLRCATPSSTAPRPRPVLAPQTQQTPARCTPPLVLALRARLTGVLMEQALHKSWRSEAGAQAMQSLQTLQRLCSSQQQLKEERRRNISGFCIAMPPQLVRALCARLELVPQTQQALARCTPLCCAPGWNWRDVRHHWCRHCVPS